MPQRGIEVHGLSALRRALKDAEGRSPKEIQQANKDAAEIVVRQARILAPKGRHEGGGNVQPIYASIKAQATSGRGVVAFGGQRAPHAPVTEFGGSIPRRGRHAGQARMVAKAHRSYGLLGTALTRVRKRPYVYPALALTRERVLGSYEDALKRITRHL